MSSFELPGGETVALVGHNGAGKTTLLKLMLGLIHPSAGTIQVLGDNPAAGEFAARRRLGYLPENVSFNAALTGREILTFYARLKREPVATVPALLDRVGLGAAAARRVGTYSKGMRQRLGLAQALLGSPQILLLDEPTTGLDPALRLSFYEIVQDLRDRGATIVLSSHALTELEERARPRRHHEPRRHGGERLDRRTASRGTASDPDPSHRSATASGLDLALARARRNLASSSNGHMIEIDAAPDQKIDVLRRAFGGDDAIEDIDVLRPTLDDLYAHFLRSQEAAR